MDDTNTALYLIAERLNAIWDALHELRDELRLGRTTQREMTEAIHNLTDLQNALSRRR